MSRYIAAQCHWLRSAEVRWCIQAVPGCMHAPCVMVAQYHSIWLTDLRDPLSHKLHHLHTEVSQQALKLLYNPGVV